MNSRSFARAARLVVLVALLVPATLIAQPAATGTRNYAVDLTIGPSHGYGLPGPMERNGLALDVALSRRWGNPESGMPVIGAALGARGRVSQDCTFRPPATTCAPDFPGFTHASLFAGIERRRSNGESIRAGVGPAVAGNNDADGGLFALDSRIDVTTATRYIGVLVSLRGLLVPNYQGRALFVGALGIGIRLE